MIRPKTYVAVFIATLMVVTERITSSFSPCLVEPTARKHAASCLDPHHCGTGTCILDERSAFEASFNPMVALSVCASSTQATSKPSSDLIDSAVESCMPWKMINPSPGVTMRYAHIWEGEYARAFEGAYFARHLEEARQQGRIGHVALDPIASFQPRRRSSLA
jgi:hypothetical protein